MSNIVKSFNRDAEQRLKKENLRAMILDLIKVSTIPAMMKKVMEVTDNPKTAVADLEKVIENDPAIASRVVAVSNAVFYGFPRKINSIAQAILVLGFEMVKGLAVSTSVFNVSQPGAAKELAAIWAHSFECAMASVILARKTGLLTKEAAFLAGLLHDLGKPIMVQACGERYLDLLAVEGYPVDMEEDVFGVSHAEAGAWFAEKCKLPEDCVASIRYHHRPSEGMAPDRKLPALALVTYLANIISTGTKPAEPASEFSEVLKALGLTDEDFENVVAEFREMNVTAPSFS